MEPRLSLETRPEEKGASASPIGRWDGGGTHLHWGFFSSHPREPGEVPREDAKGLSCCSLGDSLASLLFCWCCQGNRRDPGTDSRENMGWRRESTRWKAVPWVLDKTTKCIEREPGKEDGQCPVVWECQHPCRRRAGGIKRRSHNP